VPRRQLAPRNGEPGSGSEQPPLQSPSEWVDLPNPLACGFGPVVQQTLERLEITTVATYLARHGTVDGESVWEVMVLMPASPLFPEEQPWSVLVRGVEQAETVTRAAHRALTVLVERHHDDLRCPQGYFPIRDQSTLSWWRRVEHLRRPSRSSYDPDTAAVVDYSRAMFNMELETYTRSQAYAKEAKDAKKQLAAALAQVQSLKTSYATLQRDTTRYKEDLGESIDRCEELTQMNDQYEHHNQTLMQTNAQAFEYITHLEGTLDDLEDQLDNIQEQLLDAANPPAPVPDPAPVPLVEPEPSSGLDTESGELDTDEDRMDTDDESSASV
jgi:hypothetical protein